MGSTSRKTQGPPATASCTGPRDAGRALPRTRRGHSQGQGSEPAPGPGSLSRPQAGARDWPHASPGGVRVTVPTEPRQPPQATELPGQGGRESGGGGKAGGEPARSPGPGGAPRQTRPKPTATPAQGPHRPAGHWCCGREELLSAPLGRTSGPAPRKGTAVG